MDFSNMTYDPSKAMEKHRGLDQMDHTSIERVDLNDSMTINGGIGNGVNSGGPAYHICTDCPHDGHPTNTDSV